MRNSKIDMKKLRVNRLSKALLFILISTFYFYIPVASAAAPVISTTWAIANGAVSPVLYVDGSDFSPTSNKFDFTVDVGSTGLVYDSAAFVDSSHIRFVFHKTAQAGMITIQASASAFLPVATELSNTLRLVVPVALIAQSITFTTPTAMTVKNPDQIPQATSTSGLAVVLASNTPSVCTIDFLKFHAVAAGTCSITATQSGNLVFDSAVAVTKTFIVLALTPETPTEPIMPTKPAEVITNLGSLSYDPNNASGAYVSVHVEGQDADPNKAVLVKLLIPHGAIDVPVVFLITAYSSDQETSSGYFVLRTKMIDGTGKSISSLRAHVEINIPAGASDGFPSWSLDGMSWHKLGQLEREDMHADVHAGYFMEKDGRIAIFSDYLMLFGFRKAQEPVVISAPTLLINPNIPTQLSSGGGSGTGATAFFSHSLEVCSITPSGVLTGLSEGKCIVAAHKEATGIYSDSKSSSITIIVSRQSPSTQHPAGDPNHSALCQELSYTLLKNSTLIFVNLCEEDGTKTATLEVGTKSATGKWRFAVEAKQKLDTHGVTIFKLKPALKSGQIIRVKAENRTQISTTISGK